MHGEYLTLLRGEPCETYLLSANSCGVVGGARSSARERAGIRGITGE